MTPFPVFLSVVLLVRNQSARVEKLVGEAAATVTRLVDDYELIIVDNASDDDSVSVLRDMTSESGSRISKFMRSPRKSTPTRRFGSASRTRWVISSLRWIRCSLERYIKRLRWQSCVMTR